MLQIFIHTVITVCECESGSVHIGNIHTVNTVFERDSSCIHVVTIYTVITDFDCDGSSVHFADNDSHRLCRLSM